MMEAKQDRGVRTFAEWCEDGGGELEWPDDDRAVCETENGSMMVRLHRGNYQVTVDQENPGLQVVGSDPRGSTWMYFDDLFRYDEESVREDLLVDDAGDNVVDLMTDPDVLAFRNLEDEPYERVAFEIDAMSRSSR